MSGKITKVHSTQYSASFLYDNFNKYHDRKYLTALNFEISVVAEFWTNYCCIDSGDDCNPCMWLTVYV